MSDLRRHDLSDEIRLRLKPLERFQDKWTRLSGSKTPSNQSVGVRPDKDLEPGFVETKTAMALVLKATGRRGRRGDDNRLFINAILFKLRTGKQPGGICRPFMATGRMFPFAFSGWAAGAFLSGL